MNNHPPRLPLRFLRWFCNPQLLTYIEGDLLELFEERKAISSHRRAKWLFFWEVIKLFRPGIVRPFGGTYRLNQFDMFRNYFTVSFRNILRNKTFSFLNITGLALGIASCILILLYVNNELSYDTYNQKYERIYRTIHYFGNEEKTELQSVAKNEYWVWGNAPVGPALDEYFPEIETVFRFTSPAPWLVSYKNNVFNENNIVFGDSTAFHIFDWPIIAGNPKTALTRPNTIVLTEQLAQKYFGDEDPIGKSLLMDSEDLYEVTAVIQVPSNSHFTFDAMVSMATFHNSRPGIFSSWGYVDFYTYFSLAPDARLSGIQEKLPAFLEKYYTQSDSYFLDFEPLKDVYLRSEAARQPGPVGSLTNIYVFTSVAVFILLIACINFMNLSTARSVERAKEVAIRKTIGSYRQSIIFQFLVETVLICMAAFVVALIILIACHPYIEQMAGKPLPYTWLITPKIGFLTLTGLLGLGIISGSYPAFVLSGFKPVTVLKGSFKHSDSGVWLRKSLVVIQFSLSIILLVGTSVVYSQLTFLRKHDLGYNPNQVLVIDFGYDYKVQHQVKYLKHQLMAHPDVESVSASRATPGDFFPHAGTEIESLSGEMVHEGPAIYEIDEDFIETYQMKLVAGRNFNMDFQLDSMQSLILNESAAKLYGYANPEDIIGKSFEQWGRKGKIIGVVEDFNYVSLHSKVEPLALRYGTQRNLAMISVRILSRDYGKTVSELEEIWAGIVPHYPFDTHFNDQNFDVQYEADERFGVIFSVFAGLAVFVACLGLLGLTIYSTAQRSKEIGIRKVLGASILNLVSILSYDFIKLFLVALIVAVPASWYIMQLWLNGFAYRIAMSWQVFVLAALITLFVATLTMSIKTINAALANPVDSLRDE